MIKRIQRGTFTFSATLDSTSISLSYPVTKNKSFVRIKCTNLSGQGSSSIYAGDYLVAPELTNITGGKASDLTLRRWYLTPGGIQMRVDWEIYECEGAETVEHGATSLTSTDQEISLSDFDEGHTFSLGYIRSTYSSWSGRLESQVVLHRAYNNGSSDVLQVKGYLTANTTFYWQSIIFPTIDVQREYVTIPNTSTDHDHTIGSSVDLDHTFLLSSFYHDDDFETHQPDNFKGSRMLSTTQIRYFSWDAYEAIACSYVIESEAFKVQRGINIWSTQTDDVLLGTEVYDYGVMVNLPHQNNHWCLADTTVGNFGDFGVVVYAINLDSEGYTDDYRMYRGLSGDDVLTYYEIVDLTMLVTRKRHTSYARGYYRGL